MALKLAEEQALREEEEAKEEEASNPMKLLENRTQQSKNEIELLESLEDLKDLNKRQQTVDYDTMLMQFNNKLTEREREEKLKELDEEYIKYYISRVNKDQNIKYAFCFRTIKFQSNNQKRKIVVEEEVIEDLEPTKISKMNEPTSNTQQKIVQSTNKNKFAKKPLLKGLVRLPGNKNTTNKSNSNSTISKSTNGLSLLGNYSDSDSD